MKILISENAESTYIGTQVHSYRSGVNYEFSNMLRKIQGMWIEVETDYLFSDQFNTGPIPGVSEQGIRIMEQSVVAVEDDARIGKGRCGYCGKVVDIAETHRTYTQETGMEESAERLPCPHCDQAGYLHDFHDDVLRLARKRQPVAKITLAAFVAKNRKAIDRRYAQDCHSTVAAHRRAGWCNDEEREMAVANVESLYHWALASNVDFE